MKMKNWLVKKEDKIDSFFFCPLCTEKVSYMLAYPHLKECIYYFELVFGIPTNAALLNSNITPSNPPRFLSSIPIPLSNPPPSAPLNSNSLPSHSLNSNSLPPSTPLPSNPPSKARERIVRDVKCALNDCKLSKQTPIYIKSNDKMTKLCAFSHLKSSTTLESLNIKYPTDYISETFYCEECGEGINWLLKLRESVTNPKFEKVK